MTRDNPEMTVTGWKGVGTFGVRVGRSNAALYFRKDWASARIQVDGKSYEYPLPDTFWERCPEFRGGAIKDWLLENRLAPWVRGHPPRLELTPIADNCFRLSVA